MSLMIFHLVLSSFTFDGVDIAVASKILKWNLKRYPNGIWAIQLSVDVTLTASQVYSSSSVQGDSVSSGLNPSKPFFTTPKPWSRKSNIETSITYPSGRSRLRTWPCGIWRRV